jgi:hypothetical protein
MPHSVDTGIETLLDLDGIAYRLENGYWVKFDVHQVNATSQIPHGIYYSLTLHDRNNTRIIGFDNAHGCTPPKRKKFGGRKLAWDHRHNNQEKIVPYEFQSAAQLLEDFWVEVERVISGGMP